MKTTLIKLLVGCTLAISLSAFSPLTQAAVCKWVSGYYQNGYYHHGHKVCWVGNNYERNRTCAWRNGNRVCWWN